MIKELFQAPYVMSGQFTPENSALVLIDHQVGTLQLCIRCLLKLPLKTLSPSPKQQRPTVCLSVMTTSQEDHAQGPTAPALQVAFNSPAL
jgi:hypothetical protein